MGCGRGWVLPLLLRETGGVDPWGDLTAFCFSDNLTGTAAGFLSGCRLFFLPHGDTHLGTDLSGGGPSKTGRGGGRPDSHPQAGELGALSPLTTSPLISSGFWSCPVDKTQP